MKMWIARNPNGDLYIHAEKPFFANSIRGWLSDNWMTISCNEYPGSNLREQPDGSGTCNKEVR